MKILHQNVDEHLAKLLPATRHVDKSEITCITCKSQSIVDAKFLSRFPKLKLIVARMVGTDTIDLVYCKKHDIAVYHIEDYGAQAVAEHALALILTGARNITNADTLTHSGKFLYESFLGKSIGGKTVGIVGTGKIGLSLINLFIPFGVHIMAYDVIKNNTAAKKMGFSYVSLSKLLRQSDFVSLHVPLTAQTKHLIGGNELKRMKKGSVLVNTSRGAIIDQKALIRYINKFHAVCFDVLEDEQSFTKHHPLLSYPNVIITPHIGFYTDTTIVTIAKKTLQCIDRFKRGDNEGRVV